MLHRSYHHMNDGDTELEDPPTEDLEGSPLLAQPMLLRAALMDEAELVRQMRADLPANDPTLDNPDHVSTALHRLIEKLKNCNHPIDSHESPITLRTCDVGLYEQLKCLLDRGDTSGLCALRLCSCSNTQE